MLSIALSLDVTEGKVVLSNQPSIVLQVGTVAITLENDGPYFFLSNSRSIIIVHEFCWRLAAFTVPNKLPWCVRSSAHSSNSRYSILHNSAPPKLIDVWPTIRPFSSIRYYPQSFVDGKLHTASGCVKGWHFGAYWETVQQLCLKTATVVIPESCLKPALTPLVRRTPRPPSFYIAISTPLLIAISS